MSNDAVGYKRPPKGSRFKKGKSGNPAGRPKGARSLQGILAEELRRTVRFNENGKTRQLTKLELFVLKRVNDGIQGKSRDADLLSKLILRFVEPDAVKDSEPVSADDKKIVERFLRRNAKNEGGVA